MKVKRGANIWIAFVSAPGYYVNFMHQILANWEICSFHPGKSTKVFVGRKLHCIKVTFELRVRTKTKVFFSNFDADLGGAFGCGLPRASLNWWAAGWRWKSGFLGVHLVEITRA